MIQADPNRAEISIIIVSYNSMVLLKQCLATIREVKISVPYEIIIVDNGSTHWDLGLVKAEAPQARVIRNEDNRFYAHANNQGMEIARAPYLLLLNTDAFLAAGCVERLLEFIKKTPQAAAAGPLVLNSDLSVQSGGESYPWIWRELRRAMFINVFGRIWKRCWTKAKGQEAPKKPRQSDWISGCCWLIRGEVVRKIGGLCEELGFYGEDVEWCHRARKAGYTIWCVRDATVVHLGRGSTVIVEGEKCWLEAERRLNKLTGHQLAGLVGAALAWIGSLERICLTVMRPWDRKTIREGAAILTWHTRRVARLARGLVE